MSAVDVARVRFLSASRWIALLFGVPLFVANLAGGRVLTAWFLVGLVGVCQVSAWLASRGHAQIGAGLATLLTGIAVYGAVITGDGMSGSAATYLTIVPLVATVTGGRRMGAVTLAVVLLSMLALDAMDPRPAPRIVDTAELVHLAASRAVLVGFVGTLAILLVQSSDALNRQLDDSRAQANAANAAKSRLLAHCSHDLRTPINAVRGYTALLAEEAFVEGRVEELVDLARVDIASQDLLRVIDQVLALARLEHAPGHRPAEPLDVAMMVDALGHPCISVDIDAVPFVPKLDIAAFRRLLGHLADHLGRAATGTSHIHVFSPRARLLRVSASPPEDVGTDDGSADPFEPFRYGGLELTMCAQLAQSMGGVAYADASGLHFDVPA